jgi:hypothetical protein
MTRGTTSMPYCTHSTCFCTYLIYLWHIKELNVESTRQLCAFPSIRRPVPSLSSSVLDQQHSSTHSQFLYGPRPLLSSKYVSLESGVRNSLTAWMFVFMRVCYVVHMEALRVATHLSKSYTRPSLYEPLLERFVKTAFQFHTSGLLKIQLLL